MLLVVLLPIGGWAQSSLQEGISQFHRFQTLVESGNPGSAYSMLWKSYQNLSTAAKTIKSGTQEYTQIRTTLQDMLPWIEKAYLYSASQRQRNNAALFAQAYMDIPLMPIMVGVSFERSSNYSLIAYNAAANTYNSRDYQRVIPYFKAYLSTGDQKYRNDVLTFMMNACMKTKDYSSAKEYLKDFVSTNPSNVNVLKQAINICMMGKDYISMQGYLSKALTYQPNDPDLQKLQGQLYEETQQYEQALNIYNKLRESNPRSLDLAKHAGLCNYNLGVLHYHAAESGNNEKRNLKMSKEFFTKAAEVFADVTATETSSLKYAQALAMSYLFSEQTDKLDTANQKVIALGGVAVSGNTALTALSYTNTVNPSSNTPGTVSDSKTPVAQKSDDLPLYSVFAKQYVEERIKKWQSKDPYETTEEYRNRVTIETRQEKVKELKGLAEKDYINTYTKNIRFGREMKLRPYDAENRAFLIESKFGELIITVPRENNEAKSFENGWSGMQFSNPQFYISDDKLTLASLTFTTPAGKTYKYTRDKETNYIETNVDVQFDEIDYNLFLSSKSNNNSSKHLQQKVTIGKSDVDMNIPESNIRNDKTFAVIICNENYKRVAKVPMAKNDGNTFARYCEKTLGLPHENIRLYEDASYGDFLEAIGDITDVASSYQGDLNIIFYYAGHGIPNEQTKDAFLLPIDADGRRTTGCYALKDLYEKLGSLGARSVVVFLDACFSGAARSENASEMLVSARGLALVTNEEDPRGNMIIFSAASDDETAMPYIEKSHGLFTYYLLKKLQETKGDVTLSELGDYIKTNVKRRSTVVNKKSQTPSVVPSSNMSDYWGSLKMIP